jgi:hypothetical protein
MPADSDLACIPHADLFSFVIDRTVRPAAEDRDRSRGALAAVEEARAVCGTCRFQFACLEVHGRDYELGVVAGLLDSERRDLFEPKEQSA